jgi:hypothetical protein|tara:strand:+ start:224 stop:1051 length:828 start_codon:yes stop_codon:yes gene_type:complete
MAPRPAFLSDLGGGRSTPTGLLPPSQRDKPKPRRDFTDVSGFANMGADRSKPDPLIPAKGITPPFVSSTPSIDEIFAKNKINQGGIDNLNVPRSAPSMAGTNIAQQVLGNRYNQAISVGYTPSELIDMVNRANSFGRGINVEGEGGFGERLDNFIEFQAGNLPGVLKMNKPQVTANAPTMGEAFGDFMGGVTNLVGATGDRLAEAGPPLLQMINFGIDKLKNLQTGDGALAMQIRGLTPTQRREYDRLVGLQGFTIQEALKRVTGMATGGIATLQ